MLEGSLNKKSTGPETGPSSSGELRQSPDEANASEAPQGIEPTTPARTHEEIASEIQEIDQKIETERETLNGIREKLGLPAVQTSVAIEALEHKRGDLAKEHGGEGLNISPAIARYFQGLGEQETVRRLEYLQQGGGQKVLGKLRDAVLKGNLPMVVHLMEMENHLKLQRERHLSRARAGESTVYGPSDFQRQYASMREMDKVSDLHMLNVLDIIDNVQQNDPQGQEE